MAIWDTLIVQPIAFLIRNLYNMTHNYGVAILLFTVVAKLVLLWFAYKGKRGMLQQQRLQPKIAELQKKYGKDKQKMQQAQAKLYQDEGVSLFGGCIWMFIPFPIIIALYGAVRQPLLYIMEWSKEQIVETANALLNPETLYTLQSFGTINQLDLANKMNAAGIESVNFNFLGMNIGEVPSFTSMLVLIPLLSALFSFLSAWLMQKFQGRPMASGGGSTAMVYLLGPGFSLWIGFTWPAALGLYWIAQSVLTIPQEYFLIKYWNKRLDEDDKRKADLEERRKAAEAAQKEEDRQRRAERIAAQNQKHKPKRYKLQNKPPASKEEREEE